MRVNAVNFSHPTQLCSGLVPYQNFSAPFLFVTYSKGDELAKVGSTYGSVSVGFCPSLLHFHALFFWADAGMITQLFFATRKRQQKYIDARECKNTFWSNIFLLVSYITLFSNLDIIKEQSIDTYSSSHFFDTPPFTTCNRWSVQRAESTPFRSSCFYFITWKGKHTYDIAFKNFVFILGKPRQSAKMIRSIWTQRASPEGP